MRQMDAPATADGEVVRIEVWILELLGGERVVVDFGVLVQVFLEGRDALFELVNLADGAFEGETEGIDRALQALEEVDLHHGDEDAFATFLGEPAEDLALIGGADRRGEVVAKEAGGMVEGQAQEADFRVELFEGEETAIEVDGGVKGLGRGALREAAEGLHLAGIVRGDLAT